MTNNLSSDVSAMPVYRTDVRHAMLLFLAGLLLILLPACSGRSVRNLRLQEQWNAKCKEAADLLAGVADVRSAEAAKPRLNAVLQELVKIDEQLRRSYDSEDVDSGSRMPMTEEVAKGIAEFQRLNVETLRISKDPQLVAALGEAWQALPSALMLEAAGAIPKAKQ